MDPLTALGVAANVLQFVQFAGSLIATGSEIFHSAQGATSDNLILEDIYGKLETLSRKLSADRPMDAPTTEQERAIAELAAQCNADCGELLDVLGKVRVDSEKNRLWRSLKASLQTLWGGQKIDAMERRLKRAQGILSLHIITVLSEQNSVLSHNVDVLKLQGEQIDINQLSNFDDIRQRLECMRQEIKDVQRTSDPDRDHGISLYVPSQAVEDLVTKLRDIMVAERDAAKEQDILANIDFEQRSVRHANIPEASVETFEWIFNGEFADWLERRNGIFWVAGKPGSGKSTLMKFIMANNKTYKLLSRWAPDGFAVGAYYFWSPGSGMQKSLQGLLQSLLHDVFQKCPGLMPVAFPRRWVQGMGRRLVASPERWTEKELCEAFDNLAGAEYLQLKLCFFIDGADEFEGDHSILCKYLLHLSRSANIKFCISSRSWNVFQGNFGRRQSLLLQELTSEDISKYIRHRLESHPGWQDLGAKEEQKEKIINYIVKRTEGVFLWAFLATRLLRIGLANDTLRNLRRRLESLPHELGGLFRFTLESVDPFYREQMARTLITALHADNPLSVYLYAFQEYEYEDEDYAIRLPIHFMNDDERAKIASRTQRWLDAISCGLLEVSTGRVQFLHRTVYDCLRLPMMYSYLEETVESDFDPDLSIARASLALVKSRIQLIAGRPANSSILSASGDDIDTWSERAIQYASRTKHLSLSRCGSLLDELNRCNAETSTLRALNGGSSSSVGGTSGAPFSMV